MKLEAFWPPSGVKSWVWGRVGKSSQPSPGALMATVQLRVWQRPAKPSDKFEGPFVATVDVYDDSYESESLPAVVPGIHVEEATSDESVHRATPANVSTRPISPTISAKINQYEKNLSRNVNGKHDMKYHFDFD